MVTLSLVYDRNQIEHQNHLHNRDQYDYQKKLPMHHLEVLVSHLLICYLHHFYQE